MGVEAQSSTLTGKVLGRYRILSRLAVGGMAELWLALVPTARGDHKKVVLKTMLPAVAESREYVRMFQTEATIGSRLRHPNLVRVLDYGRLADRYFIAMEFIDGLTMRQLGHRLYDLGQPIPQHLLLRVVLEVCRGLHTAHEMRDRGGLLQFVHRDVSPENIMIGREGATKLIDFGAALTMRMPPTTARFVGKFRYVAPERIEGKGEDRRCDVYSLGVILYEYLTGTGPFGDDDLAMVSRILAGQPRPPRELNPALSPELEAITLKALAVLPEQRYPTAAALAADLAPLLESGPLAAQAEEEQRLLGALFEQSGRSEIAATPHNDIDAKTVEMAHDDLKEVLKGTREETTVVRRARLERRARGATTEARPATGARVGATRVMPSRPPLRPHADPVSFVHAAQAARGGPAPAPLTEPAPPPAAPYPPAPSAPPSPAATSAADGLPDDLPRAVVPAPRTESPTQPLAPSWLFDRRQEAAGRAAEGLFSDQAPRPPSGWFDVVRPSDARPAAPALDAAPIAPPAAIPEPSERRRVPLPEAVSCFDRGLSLLQDRLFAAALGEWERAVELDPDNRMYQVNLKRLRERISNPSSNPRSAHEHEKRESQ